MDYLSLKDLPLALAFGVVCLWFYNQGTIEFNKKYVALITDFNAKYEAIIETQSEERRQWITDQRRDRELLLERLDKNTEAQIKNANETHQLRNVLAPVVPIIQRYAADEAAARRRTKRSNESSAS